MLLSVYIKATARNSDKYQRKNRFRSGLNEPLEDMSLFCGATVTTVIDFLSQGESLSLAMDF